MSSTTQGAGDAHDYAQDLRRAYRNGYREGLHAGRHLQQLDELDAAEWDAMSWEERYSREMWGIELPLAQQHGDGPAGGIVNRAMSGGPVIGEDEDL